MEEEKEKVGKKRGMKTKTTERKENKTESTRSIKIILKLTLVELPMGCSASRISLYVNPI